MRRGISAKLLYKYGSSLCKSFLIRRVGYESHDDRIEKFLESNIGTEKKNRFPHSQRFHDHFALASPFQKLDSLAFAPAGPAPSRLAAFLLKSERSRD